MQGSELERDHFILMCQKNFICIENGFIKNDPAVCTVHCPDWLVKDFNDHYQKHKTRSESILSKSVRSTTTRYFIHVPYMGMRKDTILLPDSLCTTIQALYFFRGTNE